MGVAAETGENERKRGRDVQAARIVTVLVRASKRRYSRRTAGRIWLQIGRRVGQSTVQLCAELQRDRMVRSRVMSEMGA